MVVDFMANRNTVMIPICIGNQVVETVMTYKLLTQSNYFNPLSPKSDERQISPCNINAL